MSQISTTLDTNAIPMRQRLVLGSLIGAAALISVMGSQYPLWLCVALLGFSILYAIAKWPEASTLTVIFVLYSNAAGVAVEFHGVPFILGASFLGLLIIPFLYYAVIRRERIIIPATLCLLIVMTAVRMFAALHAKHPDLASTELITLVVEGVLLYFLIINVVRTPETLRRSIWALIGAGVFMSLFPLYQQATGQYSNHLGGFGQVSDAAFHVDAVTELGPVQPRFAGSIGEQNRFAQVLLMLVPLALFRSWGESRTTLRTSGAIAAVLITLAVVLTFSRGAAIGMVAVVAAMVGLKYVPRSALLFVAVGLACLLIAVPQYGTRMAKLSGLMATMDATAGNADGTLQSRFTEMGAAALVFFDYPLIGVGPGMFRYHYREYAERIGLRVIAKGRGSHSLYLGLAAETGIIGCFLFGAIVWITLRDLHRAHRYWQVRNPAQANVVASFILVLVAFLTTAMFLHEAYVRFFWLMMALAFVASRLRQAEDAGMELKVSS